MLITLIGTTLPMLVEETLRAEAAGAVFEPLGDATSFGPAAFGLVVADGNGTFLATQRVQLPVGQFIGVRRSTDGGRTWQTTGLFRGVTGGATRPWISVSGSRVAIGFVGGWCDPTTAPECGEAPYLVTSTNNGVSWNAPRRLDRQAFDIRVAQDGDRTWVSWERSGHVELRGTRDGGETVFASWSAAAEGVELAAADGLAVLAYRGIVDPLTRAPLALVARGDVVASTASPLADPAGDDEVLPLAVGVADGKMHVLTRRYSRTEPGAPQFIDVLTASSAGAFDTVHTMGEAGWSASLVAGHGTVGVAIGGEDGVISVATSANGGVDFSGLVPVAATSEREPNVEIGLVVRPTDRPIARFGWSVPARFVDEDGDGFVDPANDSGNDSIDQLSVYAGRSMEVTLDGCASTASAGRTITSYHWSVVQPDGSTLLLPLGTCRETFAFDSGDEVTYRLDVVDSAGERSSVVQKVAPRDLVIASLGDSVASGEGNPHVPTGDEDTTVWQDRACHRSVDAGPAVAAKRVEDADPHTSVTFVQLACSGAAVVDSPEVPGIDDPTSGGVLDTYIGQQPNATSLRSSQIDQLRDLVGGRGIDALTLSVGANDARFSEVVTACIETLHCDRTNVRADYEARVATLPSRYARLATAITGLGIAPSAVHITEYFDPTTDELGVVEMRCAVLGGAVDLLDDDEAQWAQLGVMGALNSAVAAASSAYGWHYVGGIAAAFAGHGYCSTDPWVVQIVESKLNQGNKDGAFHPNAAGHAAYAGALFQSLRAALLVPAPVAGGTATGADVLGDLVVTTATRSSIVATAVRDTGGAPGVLGSRVVDRIVSGDGGLYSFGPPAIDRAAAVGVWTELPISGQTLTEEFAAQLAVRPNAALRAVAVVQAPTGGSFLVADRDTSVLATIDVSTVNPVDLPVDVEVVTLPGDGSDPNAPPGRPVLSTTIVVHLKPGINKVLLPTTQTFRLAPDEQVSATVTVTDPPGASPADDVDNALSTGDGTAKLAMESRPLTIEFISPTTNNGRVSCGDISEVARRQIAFLKAAVPVDPVGVLAQLACGELPPLEQNESSVLWYLTFLDWLARHDRVDVMVGVVPAGWLAQAAGGAVGVASAGLRAALIEQSSPSMTLAHEVAHTFGVMHVSGDTKVTGARIDQRRTIDGIDWMSARTTDKAWTGSETWDSLLVRIGPPGGVPAPPAPLSAVLEINGAVTNDGQNVPGGWTPGDTGSPRSDLDDLELERMLVQQMDGTTVMSSDPVVLHHAEGVYGPDATPTGPIGLTYATRLILLPGATSVRLVLDGIVVEERSVVVVPDVTVTSPVAGTTVHRGDLISVDWTTAAPTGAESTATILVSQDDGHTWKPLATGLPGTHATVDAPSDLVDGDAIVRVVVVDGVRSGQGESAAFRIGVPVQLLPERVVAVRSDLIDLTVPGAVIPTQPGLGIWTMAPDGTDLQEVVPMVPPVDGTGGMVPLHPDWRSDGQVIAFDGEVSGRRDLYIVDRDGANVRRITDASTSAGAQFVCADWNPDGRQLLTFRTSGFDANQVGVLELVVVDAATGAVTPFGWSTANYYHLATTIGCPRWSPDGGEVLMATETARFGGGMDANVYVIDAVTHLSKYAYGANNGALHTVSHHLWFNFAPGDSDRFVTAHELFGQGYLNVVEPVSTPLFIGQDVVYRDLPTTVWSTSEIPMIRQASGLFGSAGFTPDGSSLWFTSTQSVAPRRYAQELFAFPIGLYTVITTEAVGHLCHVPVNASYQTTDPVTCYAPGGDGTPVDTIRDSTVLAGDALPDAPTIGISMADWHSRVSQGVDPNPPVVIADPATLPPDPVDPPPTDVEDVTPPGDPAEGADFVEPGDVVTPVATTITVRAGRTTTVQLPSSNGLPTSFSIVATPPVTTADVVPAPPPGKDPFTTGPDGLVRITPAPGFIGTTSFDVAARDGSHPEHITVVVVAPDVPRPVDDRITVMPNAVTTIEAGELLANDRGSESNTAPALGVGRLADLAAPGLRIVSVFGFDGGTAVLKLNGQIEVQASASGTFIYTIADATGAIASARVTVDVAVPTTTTTNTTSPTTTNTSTGSTSPTATPDPTAPSLSTPVTRGDSTLPVTGTNSISLLRPAFILILGGLVLSLRRRRHLRFKQSAS
ncbi:MAG: hypothetical protein ABIR32_17370 [Ilumatobacteraceae bacterium]